LSSPIELREEHLRFRAMNERRVHKNYSIVWRVSYIYVKIFEGYWTGDKQSVSSQYVTLENFITIANWQK